MEVGSRLSPKERLTGSDGAGILTYAGIGGLPPLNALEETREAATDRRTIGARARDAMFIAMNNSTTLLLFLLQLPLTKDWHFEWIPLLFAPPQTLLALHVRNRRVLRSQWCMIDSLLWCNYP